MISIFNKSHGFTLIEVMVVVLIISILSAIAIPAYQDYVIRAKITQAINGLSARQTQMEQCYQDNHSYTPASPVPPCKACVTETAENFEFTCTSTASTFTLTATGRGQMAGFVYTVDQNDVRKTASAPSGWGTSSACWVTQKGGVC